MLSISTINSGTRKQEEYYSEDESLSGSPAEQALVLGENIGFVRPSAASG